MSDDIRVDDTPEELNGSYKPKKSRQVAKELAEERERNLAKKKLKKK